MIASIVQAANEAEPSGLAGAAFVVSVIALVLSVVPIGWAIYIWRRGGEVVSVEGDLRAPIFQSGNSRPARAGPVHSVLTLTAYNRGRSPVRVHTLMLASPDLTKRTAFQRVGRSDPIPTTIAARDRARWYVDPKTFGTMTKTRGNPLVLRPLIEYGPGLWQKGRRLRIRVPDEFLPFHGQRFKSSFGYWLRTRRKRPGLGPYKFEAFAPTVVVGAQSPGEELEPPTSP